MAADSIVAQFADLFEGRKDAYGTEEGGCWRPGTAVADFDFEAELWPEVVRRHLSGEHPRGVYPMRSPMENALNPTWVVKWGCVDFDVKTKGKPSWDYETEDDAHEAALNLQSALAHVGVTSWVERTRSCGRHVWVFASTWVTAATMRRALLLACSVASVSSREVNPKQETLQPSQLGNYVRLPYPGNLNVIPPVLDGTRQMVANVREWRQCYPYPLREFVTRALEQRTPASTLEAIAAKYKAPEKPKWVGLMPLNYTPDTNDLRTLVRKLNAAGYTMWQHGPEDGDRSRGLGYLAYQARCSGLSPEDAYLLLKTCGFNKFEGRADEEIRLQQIIAGAYA